MKLGRKLNLIIESLKWKYNYWTVKLMVPKIEPQRVLHLGQNGGNNILIEDIDSDGELEIISLQSFGMWKSKVYEKGEFHDYQKQFSQKKLFALTCMDMNGKVKWEVGEKWKDEKPYLCHGHEESIKLADINQDGKLEILTFNEQGDLVIFDAKGQLLKQLKLPNDNFSVIYYIPLAHGARYLLGTMDKSYSRNDYANPWLFLDEEFNTIHQGAYLGAGHNIAIADVNKDGVPEIFIGYQLVDINGKVIWTLDEWEDKSINSLEQHADCIEAFQYQNDWYAAIAGSDMQYLIDAEGNTKWKQKLPHPQYCIVFEGSNGPPTILVDNQREGMFLFDFGGKKLKKIKTKLYFNTPNLLRLGAGKRPIHQTLPLQKGKEDEAVYFEAGVPYVINSKGIVVFRIEIKKEFFDSKKLYLFRRINDLGLSFNLVSSTNKRICYNRKYLIFLDYG